MTASRRYLWLPLSAALASAAACGHKPAAAGSASEAIDGKDLVAAWQKAGVAVESFGPVDGAQWRASSCMGGRVGNIEATLCQYGDDASLKDGQETADRAIGGALVGVPATRGHTLLVLVDRAKADPKGADSKTINTMVKAFAGL